MRNCPTSAIHSQWGSTTDAACADPQCLSAKACRAGEGTLPVGWGAFNALGIGCPSRGRSIANPVDEVEQIH